MVHSCLFVGIFPLTWSWASNCYAFLCSRYASTLHSAETSWDHELCWSCLDGVILLCRAAPCMCDQTSVANIPTNKTNKQKVEAGVINCWSKLTALPSSFIAEPDVIRYGISLWPVQVSCPSCVPCQLLVHTYPTCWQVAEGETEQVLALHKHSSATDKMLLWYQHCFGHKSGTQHHTGWHEEN